MSVDMLPIVCIVGLEQHGAGKKRISPLAIARPPRFSSPLFFGVSTMAEMLITTMKYTRRFNVAQYEHEEITVDVVPADGQSADDMIHATRAFVEGTRPKVNGSYVTVEHVTTRPRQGEVRTPANGNGKPSSDPPMATSKPDTLQKDLEKSVEAAKQRNAAKVKSQAQSDAPFEGETKIGKRGRGRPPKAFVEAKAFVDEVMASDNLEDFLDAFNEASERWSAFTPEEWHIICTDFKKHYRDINDNTSPSLKDAITEAFVRERQKIDAALAA